MTLANKMLAEIADDPFRASRVWDFAEAARVYAIQLGLGVDAVSHAVAVKLKASILLAEAVDNGQERGEIAKRGRQNKSGTVPDLPAKTLADLRVDPTKVRDGRKIAETFTAEDIDAAAREAIEENREFTTAEMLAIATKMRAREREHTPAQGHAEDVERERLRLWHGDFRDRLTELDAGTVDLIVTDPPYPKDDLPLYSDLGKTAASLLGPRGILFVWTGQIFLPEVIDRLREHLTYGWTFALQLPGSGSRIMGRHIIQAWKPVLAFTVGTWPSGEWGDDWLVSPAREKTDYDWQQNGAPAQRLIERYSAPDALIVDPFLGVGSFGAATLAAGRRFVGVELDAGRFEQANERLRT